jgi:hypothetical protein
VRKATFEVVVYLVVSTLFECSPEPTHGQTIRSAGQRILTISGFLRLKELTMSSSPRVRCATGGFHRIMVGELRAMGVRMEEENAGDQERRGTRRRTRRSTRYA